LVHPLYFYWNRILMADIAATMPRAGLPVPAGPGLAAGWRALPNRSKISAMIGAAASIALLVAVWMWSQMPDYKILFAGIPDKDGGAIITALNQMNVPYKMAEGGGAIMVPSNLVHETRLKLASQGLPKGGSVGFELLDNQKFGATQFQEQVNYQRALEGELAKSIESLGAVQAARVHLAIPKPTIFMREQQKPTASVLLMLYPGKTLDRSQVGGIMHLVSSSLPDLPVNGVSVVDQTGALLSPQNESAGQLDATQLTYVQQLEQGHIKRIMEILAPLYGAENVRAQVTADIDFSQSESTSEAFKPNQNQAEGAIRSQQISEAGGSAAGAGAQGVPGALSNQPTPAATAPITGSGATNPPAGAGASAGTLKDGRRESVTNYEVDKTVRHTTIPTGVLKRLSAAVVVNNKRLPAGRPGAVPGSAPLAPEELAQINALVKEAIGFSKERGDSINVVNAAFTAPIVEKLPETPMWKDPGNIELAKDAARYGGFALAVLLVYFGVLRPLMRQVVGASAATDAADADTLPAGDAPQLLAAPATESLDRARALAKQDPRIVANVVRNWVNRDE
jgi:flagellar M-ring protein FliF